MITIAEVDLPNAIRDQLRQQAAFSKSLTHFTRDHLMGFEQPVAATAALIAPILIAFTYTLGGLLSMIEVAAIFLGTTTLFLGGAWYTNRQDIAWAYSQGVQRRRRASEDLKSGRGEEIKLKMKSAPLFVEHDQGVIVLANTNDGKTLFFDIDGTGSDSRWFLYLNGDMQRRHWHWMRLMGSGRVSGFHSEGQQLFEWGQPPYTEAPDAWEAISLALGEPQDGDMIDLPFEEAKQTVMHLV